LLVTCSSASANTEQSMERGVVFDAYTFSDEALADNHSEPGFAREAYNYERVKLVGGVIDYRFQAVILPIIYTFPIRAPPTP